MDAHIILGADPQSPLLHTFDDDVLTHIASFVDPVALAKLSLTCTRFGRRGGGSLSLVEATAKRMIEATSDDADREAVYPLTESWTERYSDVEEYRQPIIIHMEYRCSPTKYTVKKGASLMYLFEDWRLNYGGRIHPKHFRFLWDGVRMDGDCAPLSFETENGFRMEDEERIQIFLSQPPPSDAEMNTFHDVSMISWWQTRAEQASALRDGRQMLGYWAGSM